MRNFNDSPCFSPKRNLAACSLVLVSACGDPAPGEGVDGSVGEHPMPEIVSATEAVQSVSVSEIDPGTMQESEIRKVLPSGPRCSFAYTAESPPILASTMGPNGQAVGVIKIHGRLVKVSAPQVTGFEALVKGGSFKAGDIELEIRPEEQGIGKRPSEAHFLIGNELTVGYQGWYSCTQNE